MVKRIVTIVLVLAVLGVLLTDVYQYAIAQQRLRSVTYDLATWAAKNAGGMSRDQAANYLASTASTQGVRVYQYGQTHEGIQIWTETTVGKTYAASTIVNLLRGASFSEARTKPFVIRDYREAGIQ